MIAHVELDLVDHSEIGEIDQKDFYFWLSRTPSAEDAARKSASFTRIGSVFVLDPDANSHRMDFGWIVEVDNLVANHLVVRDIEINAVIGAQPG